MAILKRQTPGSTGGAQKFNDDLLMSEQDRNLASKIFPRLSPVLDFPELRRLFEIYDPPSNRAKKRRRSLGLTAVLLAVLALLGASAEPLYSQVSEPWISLLGAIFATLGLAGVILSLLGVFSTRSKSEWLCGRLMTEQLRQFHFHVLVAHVPTIITAMGDSAAMSRFIERREQWLAAFQLEHGGHLEGKLNSVIEDNAEEDFWLQEHEAFSEIDTADLSDFFSAYKMLRIQHQLQYASYKLGSESLNSSPRQAVLLGHISVISILIVFVLHLLIAVSLVPPLSVWLKFATSPWVHVAVLWTAIAALAARALEEGLQPTREVERYTHYRAVLSRLLNHFDDAKDAREKIRIMKETERVIYQEMRGFLKTNFDAKFVL